MPITAVQYQGVSGQAYDAKIVNAAGQVWNTATPAFETATSGNYSGYVIALTNVLADIFDLTFPAGIATSGVYTVYFTLRSAGPSGSAAIGDQPAGAAVVAWTGSSIVSLSDLNAALAGGVNVAQWGGSAVTGMPLPTSSYAAPDNADITSIKSTVNSISTTVGAAGAGLTSLGDARLAHLDADISSRLSASGYVAPDNADVATLVARLTSQRAANLDNANATFSSLADLLLADRYIDKSNTNQWALVLIKKGSGALGAGGAVELLRQPLYDVDGNPLNATTTVIGRSVSP